MEERIGYRFADAELLTRALTHRSWCAEHPGEPSNERLEFLGDAVLGLVVTDYLFSRFPDMPEGQLAKTRAAVVSADALATVGSELGIGLDLRLGKGEDASGGREKGSILADAVEAVIGAMYLDGGIEPARHLVLRTLGNRIADAARRPGFTDFKTRLQETAASDGHEPPTYRIAESGPGHHKRFHATVLIGGEARGAGDGTSKKEAEQRAAEAAYHARSAEME
jgi:ribonuclease-3